MRENSIKGKEPISYRFSVRANDGTDVAELCAVFGGGGHKKAAGCTVEGTLDQARERFLAELYKRL
jgi:phosphoesterase RecJ-like protein